MNNNPLAEVIRSAYISNIINAPRQQQATICSPFQQKRIQRFEKALNTFLTRCGQESVPAVPNNIDEKRLLTYSLQISGYLRDAQDIFDKLSAKDIIDPNLIAFFEETSKYSVACNGQIQGSDYVFHEHCPYKFWKIRLSDKLKYSKFNNYDTFFNRGKHQFQ